MRKRKSKILAAVAIAGLAVLVTVAVLWAVESFLALQLQGLPWQR